METIRQIVQVSGDRKIEITLPDTVQPGLVEVIIVLQPIPQALPQSDSPTESRQEHSSQPLDLFGFLPQRVDPLQFQQQLRNEWTAV